MSEAAHPVGFGIGRLVNDIYNDDKSLASQIVSMADPIAIAGIVSAVTPSTAYTIGEMIDRLYESGRAHFVGSN